MPAEFAARGLDEGQRMKFLTHPVGEETAALSRDPAIDVLGHLVIAFQRHFVRSVRKNYSLSR